MLEVLSKALSFVLMIVLGYVLKKRGMFSATDYQIVSKVILNVTLPCAVISSFAHFQFDTSLIAAVGIGLIFNIGLFLLALLMTRSQNNAAKIFYIFGLGGVNIGCFTLPFVQAFMSPYAVIAVCMFDVGNSIMATGMTYALTASCIGYANGRKDPLNIGNVLAKLRQSTPFMVYMTALVIALLGITLPAPVYTFTNIVGAANPFLSMFMIGMMFEIALDKRAMGYVKDVLLARYVVGIGLAALMLYTKPFADDVNHVIALAFMGPMPIIGPIFVGKLDGNVPLAGLYNSVTMVCSVILFVTFFVLIA